MIKEFCMWYLGIEELNDFYKVRVISQHTYEFAFFKGHKFVTLVQVVESPKHRQNLTDRSYYMSGHKIVDSEFYVSLGELYDSPEKC